MIKPFPLFMMVVSVVVCLESKSWWSYWFMMEINSVALIIYMFKEKTKEKVLMFFLFQSLSSVLMMVFIFSSNWAIEHNLEKTSFNLMVMSMLVKIGMFPFHSWVMKTLKNFSWVLMMILLTWQKLIPIMVMTKIFLKSKKMMKPIVMSMMALNLIIIFMASMKVIITISSLIHNSWMIIPLTSTKEISALYMISYAMVLMPLLWGFLKTNTTNTSSQVTVKKLKKEMMLLTLSMGGIPPSIGFLMKMMVLLVIVKAEKKTMMLTILLISSCMTFYAYFNILMKYLLSEKVKNNKKNSMKKKNTTKEASWVVILLPTIVWG